MAALQGDLANLTLTSQDGLPHAFSVDYNGNGVVDAGEPTSPTFSSTINFQFFATVAGTFKYYCTFHPGIMFGSFVVTATHDVAVADVKPSKTIVGQGSLMQVNVTVVNLGGFNETFNVTMYRLGATKSFRLDGSASTGWNGTIPGPAIAVSQYDTVVLTLSGVDTLPHAFFVDYNGNSVSDAGEPTSGTFQSTTIKYTFVADRNGTFNYRCTFHPGTMVGSFTVASPLNVTLGSQLLIQPLAPSETRMLTFDWNTTGVSFGGYTLLAVADVVAGDINATNNSFTDGRVVVTVPGDLNGDFIVDIFDAILLAGVYNSLPDKPNWNPNADLRADGIIDIFDAIILAGHFGQSVSL